MSSCFDRLRGAGAAAAAKLCFRKLIYRKVTMMRYESPAGTTAVPAGACPYRLDVSRDLDCEAILDSNPHLCRLDVEKFIHMDSTCVAAYDGDRIVGSTWFVRGRVFVPELHRDVEASGREHYICRSFVHPDYRGHRLLQHIIYAYASQVPADDLMWGLIYPWNAAPRRTAEKEGRAHVADYWTRFIFCHKSFGEHHYSAQGEA